MARRMSLEKRSGTCFEVNDKKVVNAMAAPGVSFIQT